MQKKGKKPQQNSMISALDYRAFHPVRGCFAHSFFACLSLPSPPALSPPVRFSLLYTLHIPHPVSSVQIRHDLFSIPFAHCWKLVNMGQGHYPFGIKGLISRGHTKVATVPMGLEWVVPRKYWMVSVTGTALSENKSSANCNLIC